MVSWSWPRQSRSNVRAWMSTASGPSAATVDAARAKSRSPTMIATELPQTACADGAPRRTGAESMTSSW
ncbi:Uncharacterised protein [Mycobacteroides abscessus]|nr:Uncharacterised protein [Mycobacteroides abscessus]